MIAKEQVNSAEEALHLTEAHHSAGTMTTLDVLQAQDVAIEARLRFAHAVIGYTQAQVNLLSEDALIRADQAMYRAKARCRGVANISGDDLLEKAI